MLPHASGDQSVSSIWALFPENSPTSLQQLTALPSWNPVVDQTITIPPARDRCPFSNAPAGDSPGLPPDGDRLGPISRKRVMESEDRITRIRVWKFNDIFPSWGVGGAWNPDQYNLAVTIPLPDDHGWLKMGHMRGDGF